MEAWKGDRGQGRRQSRLIGARQGRANHIEGGDAPAPHTPRGIFVTRKLSEVLDERETVRQRTGWFGGSTARSLTKGNSCSRPGETGKAPALPQRWQLPWCSVASKGSSGIFSPIGRRKNLPVPPREERGAFDATCAPCRSEPVGTGSVPIIRRTLAARRRTGSIDFRISHVHNIKTEPAHEVT